jgi:hypothetical protein
VLFVKKNTATFEVYNANASKASNKKDMKNQNMHTQFNYLQDFEFSKTAVMAGNTHTGEMVAIRPCVENLGLNWSGQLQNIKRNSKLDQLCVPIKSIALDGKSREMICLPALVFQDWLCSLSPKSENFNIELWEQYKNGLVIHLITMLKISLDEIQRLRSIEKKYNSLKSKVGMMLNIEYEVTESRKISIQRNLDKKMIAKSLQESLFENVNQLSLED